MNRIGFLVFVCGLALGSVAVALIGFLVYEYSRPTPWLAFIST